MAGKRGDSEMKQTGVTPRDANENESNRKNLGKRLREARKYINLTQAEVATHIGIPRSALSQIESGLRRVDILELKQIAELYKRPIAYFTNESFASADSDLDFEHLARAVSNLSDNDRMELRRFADYLHARAKMENSADDE